MHVHRFSAKKFGCTDFVNPKDHTKPVQEVRLFMTYVHKKLVSNEMLMVQKYAAGDRGDDRRRGRPGRGVHGQRRRHDLRLRMRARCTYI